MTHDPELAPLDPELASLVAAERSAPPGPDGAQRARLRARLAASLVLPAAGAVAAWPAAAAVAPKVAGWAAWSGTGKVGAVLLAAAIGTGAVVGVRQATRSPVERTEAAPSRPPVAVDPAPWAAERALLLAARDALVARRGQQALDHLGEHARRFPAGLLSEERDALRVRALASEGRLDEARAAGARFETTYPRSVHGDAVRRALSSTE
jgi:hypothetical protein